MAPIRVAVTLDKERHLVANLNTLHKFKEKTGRNVWDCPMFKGGVDVVLGDYVDDIQAIAWAFLSDEDPSLTYEQVGAMLGWNDIINLFGKCLEAFSANAPAKRADPNAVENPSPGTG